MAVGEAILPGAGGTAQTKGEVPRPEYPRPQMVRPEWVCLNGSWEFQFDDEDCGLEEKWYLGDHRFNRTILVPFTFESQKSGIGDRSFHERVWYQRDIHVPSNWKDQEILLNFGAVDYRCTVWVNGSVIGAHEGGHTPITCSIRRALKNGYARLVVRAEDPPTDRYIPRGKQHWEEEPATIFYARTTGIWQTVWMEPVTNSHIVRVKTTPTIEGGVSFEFKIAALEENQYVKVTIREGSCCWQQA
jgi:beta-galactosidase/beta-glucuronidase